MLGYQRRSDPATVEAKRTVDAWKSSGELGGLRYLRICYTDGDWTGNAHGLIDVGEQPPPFPAEEPPAEFAADDEARWALSTGVDELVHPLNLLRHFVGERYRLVFVHVSGRLCAFESESGVPMTIEVSPYRVSVGFDEELLVAFERGYVRLCPAPSLAVNRAGRVEIFTDAGGALPQRAAPELPWIDPQQAQAANFLRVCRERRRRRRTPPRRPRICISSQTSCVPVGLPARARGAPCRPRGTHAPGRSGDGRWRPVVAGSSSATPYGPRTSDPAWSAPSRWLHGPWDRDRPLLVGVVEQEEQLPSGFRLEQPHHFHVGGGVEDVEPGFAREPRVEPVERVVGGHAADVHDPARADLVDRDRGRAGEIGVAIAVQRTRALEPELLEPAVKRAGGTVDALDPRVAVVEEAGDVRHLESRQLVEPGRQRSLRHRVRAVLESAPRSEDEQPAALDVGAQRGCDVLVEDVEAGCDDEPVRGEVRSRREQIDLDSLTFNAP